MTLTLVLKKWFYPKEYINVKYKGSNTYHLKAMANVKVFADKQTDRQTDGRTDRWTNGRAKKTICLRSIDAGA